jgi:nucleotide-binding universal stress UspA family protein
VFAVMSTPSERERPVIVVGVDESAASRAAMRWAVEHACATRAQIQAVAVWHLPPQLGEMPVLPCEQLEDEAQSWLREAIPPDCEVPVHTEVVRGDPTAVLLEHAQRAQLIVLGNHGHGAIHSAIFGSVVQRCAHRARCPVVLVPNPAER